MNIRRGKKAARQGMNNYRAKSYVKYLERKRDGLVKSFRMAALSFTSAMQMQAIMSAPIPRASEEQRKAAKIQKTFAIIELGFNMVDSIKEILKPKEVIA